MNTPDSVLAALKALNDLGIPHMIVGSLSSNMYGIPRNTVDADVIIQSDEKIDELRKKLAPNFRAEPQIGFEIVGMSTKHLFYEHDSRFKLEVFVLTQDAFDQSRFSRRRMIESDGTHFWLPTPEDVVVQKLRWGRLKDLADLVDVIRAQNATLDWPYIHRWCETHGSKDRLKTVLAEIGTA